VLFSSDIVANYINNAFEPVWESVRPVPIVTIDFGNGHTITRTLHGNIATYLCDAKGTVYDILPGIYDPDGYLTQLGQFAFLFKHARQQFAPKGQPKDRDEVLAALAAHADTRLKAYHADQAKRLAADGQAAVLIQRSGGFGKAAIENPIELLAAGEAEKLLKLGPFGATAGPAILGAPISLPGKSDAEPVPTTTADLPGWKELVEDTRINESVRRRAIHEKLAAAGRVKPEDVKKWLFKEVLAADLDDPTLGIGELLNKRYPFAAEDTAAKRR
jgi:hypothetical protein